MHRYDQISPIPPLTRVVKALIITCVAIFFLTLCGNLMGVTIFKFRIFDVFGLVPANVFEHFWVWQFATYIFLHGNELHLLLNMLILWYFGSEIEMHIGEKGFAKYFFVCGIGAGIVNFAVAYAFMDPSKLTNPVIGASGAIYGILVAYGVFFGNRLMLVFFLFPLKAKYFVMIMVAMEFLFSLKANPGEHVAHICHLGGMAIGVIYLYFMYIRPKGKGTMNRKDAERERLKKQFTLIVNQNQSKNSNGGDDDRGPYWN